jgi:GT2 family glycosyltransferase
MAVKDRHPMTEKLLGQLDGADACFVFDNGSETVFPGAVSRPDARIYALWNEGLRAARAEAGGAPHNVAVLNNDLEVPRGFLGALAAGLRQADDHWIAYPNWEGYDVPPGTAMPVRLADRQHLSGWAFMLRGEVGLAFDERFEWWYGDDDIQRQVEAAGGKVVCVGGVTCVHLEPGRSTAASPELQARAALDEERFIAKWAPRDRSAS